MRVEVIDRLVIDAPGHHGKSRQRRVAFDDRLVGELAIAIPLVLVLRGLDIEVLVLERMGQLMPKRARRIELFYLAHGISISIRQRNRDRPIDDDDVLVMGVVEARQLERHIGQVFALDFQIGRIEANHLVLLDACIDFLLAYLLRELGSEAGFRFLDAEIGHRHIVLELEPANLLDASFHHRRLVSAQNAILRQGDVAEQCGNNACRCDYRDESSKLDSPQNCAPAVRSTCLAGISLEGKPALRMALKRDFSEKSLSLAPVGGRAG